MENLSKLSRAEMKNVLGGYMQITCTITVLGPDGYSETGACASDNMEDCMAYTDHKAYLYNQASGWAGANYSCS